MTDIEVHCAGNDEVYATDPEGNSVHIYWGSHATRSKWTLQPMEMILAGLGGCMAVTARPIFDKMRQQVTDYRIHLQGQRAAEPPRVFTTIHLEHVIEGQGLVEDRLWEAIELAEQYCSASAMLTQVAEITHSIALVAPHRLAQGSPVAPPAAAAPGTQ